MALRKKFIDVEIPLLDTSVKVLENVIGKKNQTIKLDLSRRLRGKNLEVVFEITSLKDEKEKLIAIPKKMKLMRSYIGRIMRKRASYVEDSIKAECKDIRVIIKPFFITRKKVSRAVRNNLRRTSREWILNYLKERSYLDICREVLDTDLQKQLLPKMKKIYPLSFCEIRILETKELEKIEQKKKPETKINSEPKEKPETKISQTKKSISTTTKTEAKPKITIKKSPTKTKAKPKTKKEKKE